MKQRWIAVVMSLLLPSAGVLAQPPPRTSTESHKNRTIFTIVGGAGGFTLGLLAGLSAFDDAIDSDRKVWTTAVLSGAGGAVGGYFLGRALDRRQRTRADAMDMQNVQKTSARTAFRPEAHLLQRVSRSSREQAGVGYVSVAERAVRYQMQSMQPGVQAAVP